MILALAIGANTALFSLLDAAVLRPLPFWQPNDLAVITQVRTETGEDAQVSALDYLDWRKQGDFLLRARRLARMVSTHSPGWAIRKNSEPCGSPQISS